MFPLPPHDHQWLITSSRHPQLEFLVSQYRPDGFLILTSLIDETSIDLVTPLSSPSSYSQISVHPFPLLKQAERLLGRVSRIGATLLIGNKADLVKKRRVKQGGRSTGDNVWLGGQKWLLAKKSSKGLAAQSKAKKNTRWNCLIWVQLGSDVDIHR